MRNPLDRNVSAKFVLGFTLPSMIMMVFDSIYTMVDGIFVSNFVGTDALSAINIVYPVLSLLCALGIMTASGGSAVVAKLMGEGEADVARRCFSMLVGVCGITGLILGAVGMLFTSFIVEGLGANSEIYDYCYDYAFYLSIFAPCAIFSIMFQFFFATAGKPHLGLFTTVLGGVTNMVLDYVFIAYLDLGIKGAALATGLGFLVPTVIGFFYFSINRKGSLFFVIPEWSIKKLKQTCLNGSSEMVTNFSMAVTTFLFNRLMMHYVGADGVAAMTIVFYAQYLFTAIFLGYSSGIAPVISYNYGACNSDNLKRLFAYSIKFIILCSIMAYISSVLLASRIVDIFASDSRTVFELAVKGMDIFAIGFLFMGINIFASGFFTALSNGKISALISFMRTFVLLIAALNVMPALFGLNGIWAAVPVAECLSVLISLACIVRLKKRYGY